MKRVSPVVAAARALWQHTGRARPPFAVTPGPGQESVWDYPRPPRLADDTREVLVRAGDRELARSRRTIRVLETASPPTFYLPAEDITPGALVVVPGASHCEWKGEARYWGLAPGTRAVAWSYPDPYPEMSRLRDHVCFYPSRVACFVDGERVLAQSSEFYGGWITSEIVGPFKGEPGTGGW